MIKQTPASINDINFNQSWWWHVLSDIAARTHLMLETKCAFTSIKIRHKFITAHFNAGTFYFRTFCYGTFDYGIIDRGKIDMEPFLITLLVYLKACDSDSLVIGGFQLKS